MKKLLLILLLMLPLLVFGQSSPEEKPQVFLFNFDRLEYGHYKGDERMMENIGPFSGSIAFNVGPNYDAKVYHSNANADAKTIYFRRISPIETDTLDIGVIFQRMYVLDDSGDRAELMMTHDLVTVIWEGNNPAYLTWHKEE